MKIRVLGPGCPACVKLYREVRAILEEAKVWAEVEKVEDFKEIARAGVFATPGLEIDGELKCSGCLPTREDLKRWLLA